MRVEPLLYAALDGDEAGADVGVGRRADDADAEHGQRASRDSLDDADPAPGQTRVHPKHAHAASLRSPPATDGRCPLFVQAIGWD
ncbi:hypothetical protein GCM10010249_58270 [Streptomyces roseolilacinus]|uniref:Uncharacterized protein n=1 Tax=Streptomyces roseolilacinus TaxID=66904 RepID=A0A918EMP6_9ACTN|nr:hypothetical protein GCM10010249_58270 [Streptomyces roseolilacinus]